MSYAGSHFKLGEISLVIPEKKVTCLLGPNGSGKTTLLKAIGGLINKEGAIYIDGKADIALTTKLARKITSYVDQPPSTDPLLDIKVIDYLLTARYPESSSFFDQAEDEEEIKKIAEKLGIKSLLDRRIGELSGGEAKKVMIAFGMCKKPLYYLLDEPDAHVDMGFKPELARLVKEISKDATVIMATHDLIFAQLTCDYYVVLSEGKVVFHGDKESMLGSAQILSRVFGTPFKKTWIDGVGEIILPMYSSI